jgi:ribosome-associated protein
MTPTRNTSRSSKSRPKAKAASKSAARSKPVRNAAPPKRAGGKSAGRSAGKAPAKSSARLVVKPASAPKRKPAAPDSPVVTVALKALDDMKAVNVKTLDVRDQTDIADTMIIASGNSDRHVRSIADRVVEFAKKAGDRPMGVEGERDGEWVLVDLQDVIVHVMLPRVREFYRLESLWDVTAARREAAGQ